MADHYDVIVIGTGNAGMAAAGAVRAAGKSVAIIESREVGGTCPLRGCVPKKVLVAAAQVLHQIECAKEHAITVSPPIVDWPRLIARERTFVDGVPGEFTKSLENRGIDLIMGRARFSGRDQITVGKTDYRADKIVIATGSKPRPLPIDGAEHMITSDDILEMTALPESLIFIGGGVIALEFSHVFARAGCQVTILEVMPRLLPPMDADAVAAVHAETERIGIEILTEVEVQQIAEGAGDLEVRYTHQGADHVRTTSIVANGAGRIADVDDLDLAAGGIDHDGLHIAVDEHLRSLSNPNVYVAGDALVGPAQLSPVATYEGRVVGENILDGDTAVPRYGHIPANVYTVPALASVGLTEAEAEAQGIDAVVKTNDMRSWRSARTHAETVAYSKVLLAEDDGEILGAHIVGHGAEDIIHLFALAMEHGLTAAQLKSTVYAYPTNTSDIKFLV